MNNPTQSPRWNELLRLSAEFRRGQFHLAGLFEDKDRFARFSISHENLLLDYSKNFISTESLQCLLQLAGDMELPAAIEALFAGGKVNRSENRAALHTALRLPEDKNPYPEITGCLGRIETFVAAVHSGAWKGYAGGPISDVVHLGIGGSGLGPALVCTALENYSTGQVNVHFVSNLDPVQLDDVLAGLNPAGTLFIIASKSFTTPETRRNAEVAKSWLAAAGDDAIMANHFVAVSANPAAAGDFGVPRENIFPVWDWVGGRYSLWSAMGLPIALSLGMAGFRELLAGAHGMDRHFQEAAPGENLPVIMGLLAVWYGAFFEARSSAVIPYSQRLAGFPAYLQQLSMESLGKGVDQDNRAVEIPTGAVVWGGVGTDVQHGGFQLLHQGGGFIPVDFIACIEADSTGQDARERQQQLLVNCFSQSRALMVGRRDADRPFRQIPGNRPSNTLLLERLNPRNLGSLLALYEHKTYVQSVIWHINAFDQWGVELGKTICREISEGLDKGGPDEGLDDSTRGLLKRLQALR